MLGSYARVTETEFLAKDLTTEVLKTKENPVLFYGFTDAPQKRSYHAFSDTRALL